MPAEMVDSRDVRLFSRASSCNSSMPRVIELLCRGPAHQGWTVGLAGLAAMAAELMGSSASGRLDMQQRRAASSQIESAEALLTRAGW